MAAPLADNSLSLGPNQSKMRRFAHLSEKERNVKKKNVIPGNTQRANNKAAKALKAYLAEIGEDQAFEKLEETELDSLLSRYYLGARTTGGNLYKVSSIMNFKHSLKRYLQSPPYLKTFDTCKDEAFRASNQAFSVAVSELKSQGKGSTDHHPCINDNDRQKLYNSIYLNTRTPTGFFNKVQFDIRLYFFRRGNENMAEMNKDTFVIRNDPDSKLR